MTFEEWYTEFLDGNAPNGVAKSWALAAWKAAKKDISQRLRFHDMYTIYSDAYIEAEWEEIGTTAEDELKEIIGD